MPDCNKSRTLYSTCVTILTFSGFALAATATSLPLWGYFINPVAITETTILDKGHFGPWQICKESYYGTTKCGDGVTRFRPAGEVKIAGYFAIVDVMLLAAFCVLNVISLAMIVSREKVMMKYKSAIFLKFAISLISTLIAIIAAGLFSLQTDDKANSYQVVRGESFYMQIGVIIISFFLFIASLYDMIFLRKAGGDPTMTSDLSGTDATTFNNPGFRERKKRGGGISVTHESGKPYASMPGRNGSTISMSTTLSSNGSSVPSTLLPRSPLRSSLKKPRVSTDPGLGIHNPGFSGSSPTLPRNGSVKKVRIQTISTAV